MSVSLLSPPTPFPPIIPPALSQLVRPSPPFTASFNRYPPPPVLHIKGIGGDRLTVKINLDFVLEFFLLILLFIIYRTKRRHFILKEIYVIFN